MSNTSWKKEFAAYASKRDMASAEKIRKTILHEPEKKKPLKCRPLTWRIGILAAALLLLVTRPA